MNIEIGDVFEIIGSVTLGDIAEIEEPLKNSAFNHQSVEKFNSKLLVFLKSATYEGHTVHIFYHTEMGRCWLYSWEMSRLSRVVETCAKPQAS